MQEGLDTTSASASSPSAEQGRPGANGLINPHPANGQSGPAILNSRAANPSLRKAWSIERKLIEWIYDRVGRPHFAIILWDGTSVGDEYSSNGQLVIQRPDVLRRLCWNPNLAFGECYSEGSLLIHGDILQILLEVNRGLSRARQQRPSTRHKRFNSRSHSFAKSKSNVHHHYNLGNDFYKLWLDERLVYTCAYFPHAEATLAEAQLAKLDYVCRKLRLKPGERVAEAGCGWGALAMHMARHYGVSVKAYNLSTEQIQHARDWANREGLSSRIDFIQDDYRNMTSEFDAFVSIGMLEHVGPENYRGLSHLMSRVLTPAGRGLIHSIGRNVKRDMDPWTDKYIFPGAHPPSLREMMDLFEDGGFSVHDVENLRLHYSRTCADWLSNFEKVADQVGQMFDERFVRMWRLYLAASSATFDNGDLQLFQVVFARAENNELPWTRSDWYAKPLEGQSSE